MASQSVIVRARSRVRLAGGYCGSFRSGRYVKRMIGTADDLMAADGVNVLSWEDVQRIAGGDDRPTVTRPGKLTLVEAANAYFETRTATTPHAKHTWATFISSTSLASRPVSETTTGDLEKWLASQVPQTEDRDKRRAAQATANRRWSVLRAILNSAFGNDPARVPSDGVLVNVVLGFILSVWVFAPHWRNI